MTLKALAHTADQRLKVLAGENFSRSHVYELLAAALGYKSWASLNADALIADSGIKPIPDDAQPNCLGRACQLGYTTVIAEAVANDLVDLATRRQLCVVRWHDLDSLLQFPKVSADVEEDIDDDWAEEPEPSVEILQTFTHESLLSSTLLLENLTLASTQKPIALHVLAAIHRCEKPNPYLYEESLKGRVLNATEQLMVDNYLLKKPRYQLYEKHLKSAAESGVRQAALEYGLVFDRPDFIAMAERLKGDVDALAMANAVTTPEAKRIWLRKAAETGSLRALEELAFQGDPWAEDSYAAHADTYWLRLAAERALGNDDSVRAWTWQYVSLKNNCDLTLSTLAARHSEGTSAGEIYDDDVGGPIYVDGDEGLKLPDMSPSDHKRAKSKARDILRSKAPGNR